MDKVTIEDVTQEKEVVIDPNLECSICNDILFKPVSLNCGHTYCKECLVTTLNMKPQCPLCRTPCFLQEKNLRENITIRNHIESTYPSEVKRREAQHKGQTGLEEVKEEDIIDNKEPTLEPLNHMVVLSLISPINKVFFPGSQGEISVKINCDPSILQHACNDHKILVIPADKIREKAEYLTCIFELIDLKPLSKANEYKAKVKACDRVVVNEYHDLDLDKEALEKWNYPNPNQIVTLQVGKGHFLKDHNTVGVQQLDEQVSHIEEFLNEKLTMWAHSSPASVHFVQNEMSDVMIRSSNRNMAYFVEFSLVLARLLRSSNEEKIRMFETTNTAERLLVLKNITDRLKDTIEFGMVFEVENPVHKLFGNAKVAILALIGIIIALIISSNNRRVVYV